MAQLSITIPDAVAARVNNAFADAYGYQATINGQPNPQTKAQFAKARVIDFIRAVVRGQESNVASEAARVTAISDADAAINLT